MDKDINWDNVRINFTGLALSAILERDSSWTSKIASDLLYKKIAKHCVKLADACINELKNNELEEYGEE